MTNEEVVKIKETVAEDARLKIDPLEGDALAVMGESAGWTVMMRKANKKIAELLEPIPHEEIADIKDLALIGAMEIARTEKIEVLRWFVNQVNSEVNAKRVMAAKAKTEEPKPEA